MAAKRPRPSVPARGESRRHADRTAEDEHAVEVHLDALLAARSLTLTELANRIGITIANLSILKNGRAKAIRFTTLTRLCEELDCQPGDLLAVRRPGQSGGASGSGAVGSGSGPGAETA